MVPLLPLMPLLPQLPQLTPAHLAKCESSLSKSTDDGQTWSAPSLLQVCQIFM